ncbi:MAG: 1-deoxy-D-xylulose-5-phosphate reductoisomerase [Verrucomicrobia bacterium]|nr:1-deoxy-D-xylulose-5-phosphate reductoisomerase [Verrucomicrobiota bacterium]MCG2680228.1 1-deoxy-D-xylulose-5-phosphate reductoisomerase [Kiritimatiellia bacterium]MBU4247679.1 1-deoxy-D-xylulose-5-phosphate reductoisomerase [Verrucomicrobiota bacterium]MBU4289807.1 1-deoxy-D-xylulose-5-phosphate reductoisomerase [Verrucomicrobiota bacterium]MBU4428050.1 1-deoxy-D-xylulose-5-phosphate reductoisomerase [Verrucomicrobiota bacterium]
MRQDINKPAGPDVKKMVILGSTGSIGESALRVVEAFPSRFQIIGLAVGRRFDRALEQARRFQVKRIAVFDPESARRCAEQAPPDVTVLAGPEGLEEIASLDEADMILAAIVGMAGLKPVLAALNCGTDVALATKEVLVVAGSNVLNVCAKTGARLIPVDSEHCAVFQCLDGKPASQVRRLILTASGGPFVNKPNVNFDKVTVAEALKHPRWNMGRKVTVDSATMMNKGLELMEAHWLFRVDLDRIEVVIHPESIVHSLVEFPDGSMLAQLSVSDMRFAIQHALLYPERVDGGLPTLDLVALGALHFSRPDTRRFPCLALARDAARTGGTLPAVLNAANEIAVQEFLNGRLSFSGIWRLVERVMGRHAPVKEPDLAAVFQADEWARREAADKMSKG